MSMAPTALAILFYDPS